MTNDKNSLVEQWKKIKYPDLKKMDDDALRKIISDNAAKIMAVPSNAPTSQLSNMYQMLGENDAAGEILAERRESRDKFTASMKEWKEERDGIPYHNFAKLKAASSVSGQLVAAILEEEGDLSAEELAGWCEELAALEEATFNELLAELVRERVLIIKDGKYRLMHVCTQDLYPENQVEWGIRLLKQAGVEQTGFIEMGQYYLILHIMHLEKEPMNVERIMEKIDSYFWLKSKGGTNVTEKDFEAACEFTVKSCLQEMYKDGVTQRVMIDGVPYYYFYRLGVSNNLANTEEKKVSVSDGEVTTTQTEEEQYRNDIQNYLESENQALTITEIEKGCPEIPRKKLISALYRMREDGILIRYQEDIRAYFELVKKEEC